MRKIDGKLEKKQQLQYYQAMYIDEDMTIVKNRIAEVRKERGMSQAELARMLLVNSTYLYRVESQQCNPSIDLLIAIARILGVGLEDLIEADVPHSVEAQGEIEGLELERDRLEETVDKIRALIDNV